MKKKYKIILILSILILLVLGLGLTYSIFHSSTLLNSSDQNIAKFIFNAQQLDELELALIDLNPGDSKDYNFSVSNVKSEKISNVTVEYQLKIKTYHLVPLAIELYGVDGENEELLLSCDETYTRSADNELICDAPIKELNHALEEVDNYKLKVTFPDEYDDVSYSNLVDYIDIEIKSWQKIKD